MEKETIIKLNKSFEESAYEQDGVEYWLARELQELLGYSDWRNFLNAVDKAKKSYKTTGEAVLDHFVDVTKIFDNADFGYAQITVNRPLKDEKGKMVTDSKGTPKPDPKLKDTENIPLKEDIQDFFEREVMPFAPDAWWDKKETKIGYEINFAKYFYKHQTPRSLSEIAKDIFSIEQETDGLLKEIIES